MRNDTLYLALAFLITCFAPAITAAVHNKPSAQAKRTAKAAFIEGGKLFEKNDFKGAAQQFRKAHEAVPTWKLLYNIGQAEAAAKHYGLALDSFERYLAMGGDAIPLERREEVLTEIERLRTMTGFVEVNAPKGTQIYIDDIHRGVAPLPGRMKVTAGIEHVVMVTMKGNTLLQRTIIVSGGETIVVEANVKSDAKVSATANSTEAQSALPLPQGSVSTKIESPTKAKPFALKPLGFILTGTGSALLIGGGVAGVAAMKKKNSLESSDNCTGTTCTNVEQSKIDSLQNTATVATVLFVAGGTIALTGIALLVIHKLKKSKAPPKTATNVIISPMIQAGNGGVMIQGSF